MPRPRRAPRDPSTHAATSSGASGAGFVAVRYRRYAHDAPHAASAITLDSTSVIALAQATERNPPQASPPYRVSPLHGAI